MQSRKKYCPQSAARQATTAHPVGIDVGPAHQRLRQIVYGLKDVGSRSAKNLAAAIAANEANYRYAIDTCLPEARKLNAQLRAIYLAHKGLQPKRPLPAVYVLFGANNSGGTANRSLLRELP